MFDMIPFPTQSNIGNIQDLAAAPYQLATIFARRNGVFGHVPMADKNGQAIQAALANGASITIGTVSAGKSPIVTAFSMSGSAAGLYTLSYNAVAVWRGRCAANTTVTVNLAPLGLFFATVAATFTVTNNTGVASDTDGAIAWAEV